MLCKLIGSVCLNSGSDSQSQAGSDTGPPVSLCIAVGQLLVPGSNTLNSGLRGSKSCMLSYGVHFLGRNSHCTPLRQPWMATLWPWKPS